MLVVCCVLAAWWLLACCVSFALRLLVSALGYGISLFELLVSVLLIWSIGYCFVVLIVLFLC